MFQPLYVLDIVNTFSKNDISLSLGGNFELENYGMDFNSNLIKMKSFIDIYFNRLGDIGFLVKCEGGHLL